MTHSSRRFAESHLPRVECRRAEDEPILALPKPDVIFIRNTDLLRGAQEKQIKNPDSYYRASVCLREVEAEVTSNGRTFFCGLAPATRLGTVHEVASAYGLDLIPRRACGPHRRRPMPS